MKMRAEMRDPTPTLQSTLLDGDLSARVTAPPPPERAPSPRHAQLEEHGGRIWVRGAGALTADAFASPTQLARRALKTKAEKR